MSRDRVRRRAVSLWSAATALVVGLTATAVPELAALTTAARAPRSLLVAPLDQLLVWVAAVALVICSVWLWVLLTLVVTRVSLAPTTAARRPAGVPRALHRWVLAACGLALTGGLVAPAHATGPASPGAADRVEGTSLLGGLPLPERATASDRSPAPGRRPAPPTTPRPRDHVVRPGDSLWGIAAGRLPADACDAEISAAWRSLHELNRAEIGADPDLIHPTQRLRLPGD